MATRTELDLFVSERDLSSASILELPRLVETLLTPDQRDVFGRIFSLGYSEGPLIYSSPTVREHVAKRFKTSEDKIMSRRALTITNRVLRERTLFNLLRVDRPLQTISGDQLKKLEEDNPPETCDFCHPEVAMPDDPFGNIEGEHCFTRANTAGYVGLHSLVIPKDIHHPLEITEEVFVDMVRVGNEWFQKANQYNPEAKYPRMGVNFLPRAGASIFHPHLQVLLEEELDPKMEDLRWQMATYQWEYHYPYLDELAFALRGLGLVKDLNSAHIIFNPTATKEKEVIIYTNVRQGSPNEDFSRVLHMVLAWWKKNFGTTSFNMAVFRSPLGENLEQGDWHNFFPFARVVDRGPEGTTTSDFGFMETLYRNSVVATDPFKLAQSFDQFYKGF